MDINITTDFSSALINTINCIAQKFGIVIDWTAENVTPYLQQLAEHLCQWEIASSKMFIWIAGAVTASLLIITILAELFDWDDAPDIFSVLTIIAFFIFLIILGVQLYDIIEVKNFPEKFVFEYIQNYFKMHS